MAADAPRQRIAVFCGAYTNADAHARFSAAAAELGRLCAERNATLIACGLAASQACAQTALKHGGLACSVIDEATFASMDAGERAMMCAHVVQSADVHAAKATAYGLSTAIVVLPGGYEALDVAFEAACWSQLGCHDQHAGRAIGVLNVGGFFDGLLAQVRRGAESAFIGARYAALHVQADSAAALLDAIEAAQLPPPIATTWTPFPCVLAAQTQLLAWEEAHAHA